MRKIIPLLSLILIGFSATGVAQESFTEHSVSINISAVVQVPADLIIYNINVNAEAETPQETFDLHKEREAVLATLLKEFEIKDDDISFQPIRINRRPTGRTPDESMNSVTMQQVSVTFSDFEIYEKIQVSLIENGFDNFSASFSSTKTDHGKEEALRKALQAAKARAEVIAEEAGFTLGKIIGITHSDFQVATYKMSSVNTERLFGDPSSSMMDFSQTLDVTSNIQIEFAIK